MKNEFFTILGSCLFFSLHVNAQYLDRMIDPNFGALSVSTIDIDQDGDKDILSASFTGDNQLAWWENDGTQNFTKHLVDIGNTGARFIAHADLNGDGHIDLVGTNTFGNKKVVWWENDGNQAFTRRTIDDTFTNPFFVRTADMDGDGDIDVLSVENQGKEVAWWENDGTGTFIQKHFIHNILNDPLFIIDADLDQDGDIDVIASYESDPNIVWWENDGTGVFGPTNIIDNGEYFTTMSMEIIDVDGDNDLDVLASQFSGNEIAWWENDGNQGFRKRFVSDDTYVIAITSTDYDQDGDLDVFSTGPGIDNLTVWANDGSGNFVIEETLACNFSLALAITTDDMDQDGDADIISVAQEGGLIWWELCNDNDGDGVSVCDGDCDDNDPTIYPGNLETCNGKDNNCDGIILQEPEVNITQQFASELCQGYVKLVASSTDPSTIFNWSTGETGPTITVEVGGQYEVGATTTTGCIVVTSVEAEEVLNPAATNSYTMLADDGIYLKNNVVKTGGIGVINENKKVKLKNYTFVKTFVKSPIIENSFCSSSDLIYDQADVPLPAFQYNEDSTTTNLIVPKYSTYTITADDANSYNKIIVKTNATLIVDIPILSAQTLKTHRNASIQFTQNTHVLVKNKMTISKYNWIANNDHAVTFFVEDEVKINRGTYFIANIFSLENLKVASARWYFPTIMKGFFKANKVIGYNYTAWYAGQTCGEVTPSTPIGMPPPPNDPNTSGPRSEPIATENPIINDGAVLKVYPNPSSGKVFLSFNNSVAMSGLIEVFSSHGMLLEAQNVEVSEGEHELNLGKYPKGVYLISLTVPGQAPVTKRVMITP